MSSIFLFLGVKISSTFRILKTFGKLIGHYRKETFTGTYTVFQACDEFLTQGVRIL